MSAALLPTAHSKRRVAAEPPEQVDVAVVGAGMSSLTAAAYLARAGLKVAVFDGHYVAGGCCTQFARGSSRERYLFDVGLHYVGECGPGETIPRLLEDTGAELEFAPLDPDGFDTFCFPDFTFRVPANLDLYRQRLLELFPEEKRAIDKYLGLMTQIGRSNELLYADNYRNSPLAVLRILLGSPRMLLHMSHTASEVLDRWTQNPKLKAVLLGQHGDYALPPSQVAIVVQAGLANHYARGAWYPKGGGQALSEAMASAVERAGASIHLNRPVRRILLDGKRALGLEVEGPKGQIQSIRARAVLSGADLQHTLEGLVGLENLPRSWSRRRESWTWAGGLFMTFLGVEADLGEAGLSSSNYWIYDSYNMEDCYSYPDSSQVTLPRCTFLTSTSLKDPQGVHAPDGVDTLELISVCPKSPAHWGTTEAEVLGGSYRKNPEYLARKQAVVESLIQRVQTLAPGAADRIRFQESATPLTQRRFTGATEGSPYGLALTPQQLSIKRPGWVGPLKGLFLCGHSVRNGHGIVGAMLSGRSASYQILRRL